MIRVSALHVCLLRLPNGHGLRHDGLLRLPDDLSYLDHRLVHDVDHQIFTLLGVEAVPDLDRMLPYGAGSAEAGRAAVAAGVFRHVPPAPHVSA